MLDAIPVKLRILGNSKIINELFKIPPRIGDDVLYKKESYIIISVIHNLDIDILFVTMDLQV